MKKIIIQFLLIIVLALISGIVEIFNKELMFELYRGTIIYIASLRLTVWINGLESD